MTITIADGRGALWQWDTGRRVKITDGVGVKQIHYQKRCFGCSVDVDVENDGTAIIPDELLQDYHRLTAYAYATDDTGAYTMVQQDFAVYKRAKPADYVYTPTEHAGFDRLRSEIGDLADLTTEAKDTLVAAINEVALSSGTGSMSLRVADGHIQYSTDSGETWQNLIAVADLKGADGTQGDTGAAGHDGHSPVVTATKSGKTTTINAFRAAMISGDAGEVVVPPQEYTVTNTLTGCTSSNAATTVTEGDAYYATITASNGYVLNGATVVVKMGGTDVTALHYADGVISIPDVSGNIEITITAAVYVPSYTNVLPTAVDPGTKSGVWDGKGYRNGAYASSAKPFYGTDAACWCTGAIAVQPSDVIYVKGATLEGSGHERLGAFSSYNGNCYWCKQYTALSGMATVTKLGDKYYKIVLDASYADYNYIGYIMFSAQGTGDGVVVTKNEEIL